HPRSFRQPTTHRYRLQVVTDHRPHLDQLCAVPQHPQNLNAFSAVSMDLGKIPSEHDLQNQLGISTIILLSPVCSSSYLSRMACPYCVTKLFKHRFKPRAVSSAFYPHDHLAGELGVECAYIILAMIEL